MSATCIYIQVRTANNHTTAQPGQWTKPTLSKRTGRKTRNRIMIENTTRKQAK
jgi:hypothetical protein